MRPTLFTHTLLSRRTLLKSLWTAPLLLRPSPFYGSNGSTVSPAAALPPDYSVLPRYVPSYPARSPLEDVLRKVPPGSDEFTLEGPAHAIGRVLERWSRSLQAGALHDLRDSIQADVRFSPFTAVRQTALLTGPAVETVRYTFAGGVLTGADQLLARFEQWMKAPFNVLTASFEVTAISDSSESALDTEVRYSIVSQHGDQTREQRVGTWRMLWAQQSGAWRVRRWQPVTEQRGAVRGPGFEDVSAQAFKDAPSYRDQLLRGSDEWRAVLDAASGIDVYGNNGIAAGDYNNDGFDDLYVSQPAGLPNRLYRNRGDGTFEDVTETAGVGVLDNTACALFADFRNVGLQDLLVVCGSGPLLFVNRGDGSYTPRRDAFRFSKPPEGTFTGAAVADCDGDGRLDVYFCLYSYYLGLDQYHYPTPYFDARNGPPNFLFHNQGDGTFVDRTEAAGLNADNNRYSFACAWGQAQSGTHPDLYVVNDFGRNNLYRNNGDGTFRVASTASHVEDVGAGMSAAWGDYNNDGRPDLYVANMWSAAGQRVSQQANFHPEASGDVRALYQQHARGNGLYSNQGDSTFRNVTVSSGADAGRWAWGSDFFDFDHSGYAGLYVTNGYITAPTRAEGDPDSERGIDLGSFFWRQVVGKSSNDAAPSPAYEHGWNALNELIRTDHSWNGNERNVLFANNRDGTFTEVSGPAGLDCLEDSRSFALADLDGDGRLELILKNRSAPQLRVFHNHMQGIGSAIVFRLQGRKSNRDAIGASVTVTAGELRQTKFLQAGSGFLSQHSKELHFGLGTARATIRATVRWPSGLVQEFADLQGNSRLQLIEGEAHVATKPFATASPAYVSPSVAPATASAQAPPTLIETWLLDPLRPPSFALPDLSGRTQTLDALRGSTSLLLFWSVRAPASVQQLHTFHESHTDLTSGSVRIIALNVDGAEDAHLVRAVAEREHLRVPVIMAGPDTAGVYNLIFRYLYDRRNDLPLPSAFLLDPDGMIVKVYQGLIAPQTILGDARSMPATQPNRLQKALPFPGVVHDAAFTRNDFTYGVAMFQHGYLEQAAASFQQVIAARPNDAEGYYNLGTLSLRANRLDDAGKYLQQTLTLKPDYPEAWNNLGMVAAQQGQPDAAIQHFQKSLALRPSYSIAMLNLGNVYRRQHNYARASEALSRALQLQPDDPEVNYSMGMLAAQQNDTETAARFLQRALDLRQNYPEALNNMGVLLVRRQQYEAAENNFKAAIRYSPTSEDSYMNLARLYVLQHDPAKAKEALTQLLKLNPDSAAGKQALQALDAAH